MQILVDADACPVKHIIIRMAQQKQVPVVMLTDTSHEIKGFGCTVITVDKARDSVDYALMGLTKAGDIVVTQDYGLAAMALGKQARVIHQSGLVYTSDNIDGLLMDRHMGQKARRAGARTKGPAKRTKADDARFEASFAMLLAQTEANGKLSAEHNH